MYMYRGERKDMKKERKKERKREGGKERKREGGCEGVTVWVRRCDIVVEMCG